ncbi:MAG: hypothetical protein JWQ60_325, partial [Pseudonocardia sp.]|nr:hypothetical protein [Pseudonocardia sp.]
MNGVSTRRPLLYLAVGCLLALLSLLLPTSGGGRGDGGATPTAAPGVAAGVPAAPPAAPCGQTRDSLRPSGPP